MNAANSLTMLRIALVPLFAWLWSNGRHTAALLVFIVAGASDLIDGLLARLLDQKTRLGAILDPAADKLMLFVSFLVAASLGAVPWWLAVVVIGRDAVLCAGVGLIVFALRIRFDLERFHPTRIGKYATVFQLATITLAVALHPLSAAGPRLWLSSLALVCALFTIASGMQYVVTGIVAVRGAPRSMPRQSHLPTAPKRAS